MQFHEYLRLIRERSGLTIIDTAKKLGVMPTTYRSWEKGFNIPFLKNLCALEKIYDLPKGTLMERFENSKDRFKKIYIIHPLRNMADKKNLDKTVEKNREEVSAVCSQITIEHPNVLIMSPIHAFFFIDYRGDQKTAFSQCNELIDIADEVWVYGDYTNSEGCLKEIERAKGLKIPVIYKVS